MQRYGFHDDQRERIEHLSEAGKTAVAPFRSSRLVVRDYDRHLYKARRLIENFFAQLKQFRGIATRYDTPGLID